MLFTFLPGSTPPGVAGGAASFYAWASVTEGDEVVAWDYAPDAAWLNGKPADELGCPPVAPPKLGPAVMAAGSRELLVPSKMPVNARQCCSWRRTEAQWASWSGPRRLRCFQPA